MDAQLHDANLNIQKLILDARNYVKHQENNYGKKPKCITKML